jgi:hypothetical protein
VEVGGKDYLPNMLWRCKECDVNICSSCLDIINEQKLRQNLEIDVTSNSNFVDKIADESVKNIVNNYLKPRSHAPDAYLSAVYLPSQAAASQAAASQAPKKCLSKKSVAYNIIYKIVNKHKIIEKDINEAKIKVIEFVDDEQPQWKCDVCHTSDIVEECYPRYSFREDDVDVCNLCVEEESKSGFCVKESSEF